MTITRAFILACATWTDAIARARADYYLAPNRACEVEGCHWLLDDTTRRICRRCRSEARRQASDYMRRQRA